MITNYLEYLSMRGNLERWQQAYHEDDNSPITNEEYDIHRKDVQRWERDNPTQAVEASPVYNVGYIHADDKKEELRHGYPMLSIENAMDDLEAQAWLNQWVHRYGPDVKIIGEFKYDGMAIAARYLDGKFTRALTRGDGEYGHDVTRHAACFVREHIETSGVVEIRGEAVIKRSYLEYMNSSRDEQYANCRNAVAGLLRRSDTSMHTSQVMFIPYDVAGEDLVFNTYLDKLEALKQMSNNMQTCFMVTAADVAGLFKTVTDLREKGDIPYDIDGMVFKINDVDKQEELGVTDHSPRHMFAYKFPPTKGVCRVLKVVFQVGRSGEVAPVAKITATPLLGVVVTSVLLHNEERMKERKIASGNTYEVYRSADVIPHLGKLIKEQPGSPLIEYPSHCPSCDSLLVKRGALYFCENAASCPAQLVASIAYAVSSEVLNIDGLGEQTIQLLINKGLVHRVSDLYTLNPRDVSGLNGYTDYSATKLLSAIWRSTEQPMERFIMALSIPEVAKSTARKIATKLHQPRVLFELNTPVAVLELKIPDVGPATAGNIAEYFSNPVNKANAIALYERLQIENRPEVRPVPNVVGKTFVFTGKFLESRKTLENLVLLGGGFVVDSISNRVDYLVAGTGPGGKLKKATLLSIDTIDERVFLSFFENPM